MRFIGALDRTPAAQHVQRVDVNKLTLNQRKEIQAVPTIVLDDGRRLTGAAAFEWLKTFEGGVTLGSFEPSNGLAFSECADNNCTLKYTQAWSVFNNIP